MDQMLLCVSTRTSDRSERMDEIHAIMAIARPRNAMLGVSGALLATGLWFAQILEGPLAALTELMDSIGRDPRHRDVVVHRTPLERRRFDAWSVAYAGTSRYFDRFIAPVAAADAAIGDMDRLVDLIGRLVSAEAGPAPSGRELSTIVQTI